MLFRKKGRSVAKNKIKKTTWLHLSTVAEVTLKIIVTIGLLKVCFQELIKIFRLVKFSVLSEKLMATTSATYSFRI